MTIANIDINGHTYTDAMWRADWEGTISAIANDIAAAIAGADLVGGTLHKTLTGDYALTAPESLNRIYVYSGSLGGLTTVYFAVSFQGLALIDNNTNQSVQQALAGSGIAATIPAGGTMLVYCDGVGVYNAVGGIVSTAAGISIPGTLVVGNGMTVTGNATFANAVVVSGDLTANHVTGVVSVHSQGTADFDGNVNIDGTLHVSGVSDFSSTAAFGNHLEVVGDLYVDGGEIYNRVTAGESRVHFSSPTSMSQWIEFDTGPTARWLIGKNNAAESGAESGSNFEIVALTDAGEFPGGGGAAGVWMVIYRKTGHIKMLGMPSQGALVPAEGSKVLYYDANGFVKISGV